MKGRKGKEKSSTRGPQIILKEIRRWFSRLVPNRVFSS